MSTAYPTLHQLFGAYFHQDWTLDDGTADDVIDRYLRENDHATATAAASELVELLATNASEEELARTTQALGCEYYPPGDDVGYRVWLEHVQRRLMQ